MIAVCKKERIRCDNIIKQYKRLLTLIVLQKKTKEHNPNLPQIPDHPYRILVIGRSGSGKTNALFDLISYQPDLAKIYLYAKLIILII